MIPNDDFYSMQGDDTSSQLNILLEDDMLTYNTNKIHVYKRCKSCDCILHSSQYDDDIEDISD
jgi:hypothetical protein